MSFSHSGFTKVLPSRKFILSNDNTEDDRIDNVLRLIREDLEGSRLSKASKSLSEIKDFFYVVPTTNTTKNKMDCEKKYGIEQSPPKGLLNEILDGRVSDLTSDDDKKCIKNIRKANRKENENENKKKQKIKKTTNINAWDEDEEVVQRNKLRMDNDAASIAKLNAQIEELDEQLELWSWSFISKVCQKYLENHKKDQGDCFITVEEKCNWIFEHFYIPLIEHLDTVGKILGKSYIHADEYETAHNIDCIQLPPTELSNYPHEEKHIPTNIATETPVAEIEHSVEVTPAAEVAPINDTETSGTLSITPDSEEAKRSILRPVLEELNKAIGVCMYPNLKAKAQVVSQHINHMIEDSKQNKKKITAVDEINKLKEFVEATTNTLQTLSKEKPTEKDKLTVLDNHARTIFQLRELTWTEKLILAGEEFLNVARKIAGPGFSALLIGTSTLAQKAGRSLLGALGLFSSQTSYSLPLDLKKVGKDFHKTAQKVGKDFHKTASSLNAQRRG